MAEDTKDLPWRKSSASGTGNCVLAAARDGVVFVADSKNPEGPVLTFTATEWVAFLQGVRCDEFEMPVLHQAVPTP